MTDDLVGRLLAAIQEREEVARQARMQALSGEWVSVFNAGSGDHSVQTRTGSTVVQEDGLFEIGPHVALNDPAAVLRLCQAHRKIVDSYKRTTRLLAEANQRVLQQVVDGTVSTRQEQRDFESLHIEESVLAEVIEVLAEGYGIEATP